MSTDTGGEPKPTDNLPGPGTRQIVIHLAPSGIDTTTELRELALNPDFKDLATFLSDYPNLGISRVITCVSPQKLRQLEAAAADSEFPCQYSLAACWRLDFRGLGEIETVLSRLRAMPWVQIAYEEAEVHLASATVAASAIATGNPYAGQQGYLCAAPEGIDAHWAWQRQHGRGDGVDVIDIESAWILDHEDLPGPNLLYLGNGSAPRFNPDHGAAALGVIGAVDNDRGVIGIAPNLASLDVVSHYDRCTGTELHVADAILAAIQQLGAGSILLLEVQRYGRRAYPTEINPVDLCAIRLAAAKGIIVIEPAANGGQDLASWDNPKIKHSLDPDSSKYVDSGAIIVAASKSGVTKFSDGQKVQSGHERHAKSNYGARVNCYAWGEKIVSCGYGTLNGVPSGSINSYCDDFGRTSGASAIIAGVAAIVQGWCIGTRGAPLTPKQMRAVLANPLTGTAQANPAGELIGVMPDLKKIMGT